MKSIWFSPISTSVIMDATLCMLQSNRLLTVSLSAMNIQTVMQEVSFVERTVARCLPDQQFMGFRDKRWLSSEWFKVRVEVETSAAASDHLPIELLPFSILEPLFFSFIHINHTIPKVHHNFLESVPNTLAFIQALLTPIILFFWHCHSQLWKSPAQTERVNNFIMKSIIISASVSTFALTVLASEALPYCTPFSSTTEINHKRQAEVFPKHLIKR